MRMTTKTLILLFFCAMLAAPLTAEEQPARKSLVIVIARAGGGPPDPRLQAVIADAVQFEVQRAGFQVLAEEELRRKYFPEGLPEFSRTVLLQELSRRTPADFLVEAVFTSEEQGVRLDCYLSDLYHRELLRQVTRSREVDLLFDQMVIESIAELTPVMKERLATLPPPEERGREGGTLGIGQGAAAAGEQAPPSPPPAAAPAPAEQEPPQVAQAPTVPPVVQPDTPQAPPPRPATPARPTPSPPAPPREPAATLRAPQPPRLSLGVGFAPFLVTGEARGYFEMGYLSSLYAAWFPSIMGRHLGIGLYAGANLFRAEGQLTPTDNLLSPFGPDLRLVLGSGRRLSLFAHVSGGPAIVTVGLGSGSVLSKTIPYALGGAGLQLRLLRHLGLAADVSYLVFFEEFMPIMGVTPSLYLTLNW